MLALQERHSYQRRKSNNTCVLKVNDIVLVKCDSAPRLSWQKRKGEKLIHGDDNLVLGADVCAYYNNGNSPALVGCHPHFKVFTRLSKQLPFHLHFYKYINE